MAPGRAGIADFKDINDAHIGLHNVHARTDLTTFRNRYVLSRRESRIVVIHRNGIIITNRSS